MKRSKIFLLTLCLAGNVAGAADLRTDDPQRYAELRDTTFNPLFQAMRAGNITEIKRYISGETYAQYRVLLDQNKEYGQFLRNYYAGTEFELAQVIPVGGGYVADVLIHWPNGNVSQIALQVHNVPDATQATAVYRTPPMRNTGTRWTVGSPVVGYGGKQGK
jgi:hypothetical protein